MQALRMRAGELGGKQPAVRMSDQHHAGARHQRVDDCIQVAHVLLDGPWRAVGSRVAQARAVIGDAAALRAQRSEEHTSELQSLMRISYAVFCLHKQKSI